MDRITNLFLLIAVLCHPFVESYGYFDKDEHFGPDRHYLPSNEDFSDDDYSDYSGYDGLLTDKNRNEKKVDRHNGFPHFGSNFDYHGPNYDYQGPNKFHHQGPNIDHHGPNKFHHHEPNCHDHGPDKFNNQGSMNFNHHPSNHGQMNQGPQRNPMNQFGQMNQGPQKNPMNQFAQQNPSNGFDRPPSTPDPFWPFLGQNFNQFGQMTSTTQRPTTNFWTTLLSSLIPSTPTPRPLSPPQSTASPRGPTTPTSLAVLMCIRSCPVTSEYNPVCGSNNVTYNNLGRLECAINCGAAVTLQRSSSCAVAPTQSPILNPNSDTTVRPTTSPSFETKPTRYTTIDFTSSRPDSHTGIPNPDTISPDVLSSIFSTKPPPGTDYDGDIDIRFES